MATLVGVGVIPSAKPFGTICPVPTDPTEPSAPTEPALDEIIEQLRTRVAQRRQAGEYPNDLEEVLDEHFRSLVGTRPESTPAILEELEALSRQLSHYRFVNAGAHTASEVPGGQLAHTALNKVFARQVDSVLQQLQTYAAVVARATALLTEATAAVSRQFDSGVLQQLDDLQVRWAEHARALRNVEFDLADTRARIDAAAVHPWYSDDRFVEYFRGDSEDLRTRYEDLAKHLIGCDPVLDIGFGHGEFLELLRELGVEARGVEPDGHLVALAAERGLDVERGYAVPALHELAPESLGGLVMIQVVEHLPAQQLLDVVALSAEKVRPGGKVVIETINPTSLYPLANAFWIDPDHVRPVHPMFLEFLFKEAGFANAHVELRSPVPDDEQILPVPGDDETTAAINENFRRVSRLVFGYQDYALIATR
jgi:2-polyprenyl-3-methyl-5-hydroxy-6-metoxy-1,4-benzoquinol methylase